MNSLFLFLFPAAINRVLEVGAAQGAGKNAGAGPVEAPGFNVARLEVTRDSRMHAAVLLNTVYDDLQSDGQRTTYHDACMAFVM